MNKPKPRALTEDECREILLSAIRSSINSWANNPRAKTDLEKLSGLACSILSILDGCTLHTPAFAIKTFPADEDKEFFISRGENWWPKGKDLGPLHDYFRKYIK